MSVLKVDTINEKTSGNGVAIPGHVVQVKQTSVGNVFSTAIGSNFAEMTDFRTNITPNSTNSKILVRGELFVGQNYYQVRGRILRDSTPIGLGTARSSRTPVTWCVINYSGGSGNSQYEFCSVGFSFLDSPSTTNEITYSLDIGGYSTSYTVYLNRNHHDNNASTHNGQPLSSITLMEIAQ